MPFVSQRLDFYLMGILPPFSKEDFLSSHVKPPDCQFILLHKNSFSRIPKIVFVNFSYLNICSEFLQNHIHLLSHYTKLFTHLWNHCRFTSNCSICQLRPSVRHLIFRLTDRNSVSLSKFWWNYILPHVLVWM